MNDFTKDELERLKNAHYWQQYENIMPCDAVLQIKIQSLIDNYCEHEWSCWDDEFNTRVCIKCDETRRGEVE